MDDDQIFVLHGFLALPALKKLKLVEAINEYFDSMNREPIRGENETAFRLIDQSPDRPRCPCCGR
jgi:hypothetical protein